MRAARLALTILFAAFALSATACTNPTGPTPASDDIGTSGI